MPNTLQTTGALNTKYGVTLISAWISNHKSSKLCDEITYLFANYNGFTVEVWEWIRNFIPYFMMCVITYPLFDES